uniref:Retrotransposon gag domain-containing protein n=1 Tax=Peronospora matthiolae TaxID=2874970 RepID=A0AAV1UBB9_9STRA
MESADSHGSHGDAFEPYDLDIDGVRRPHLATTEAIMGEGFAMQRIRMSAIADLKEFSGRNHNDDRARSWLRKVTSAFLRDQTPDSENCLVFGDLLTGPARNWYLQLSRLTRNKGKELLESFLPQYCGRGISAGRQYYHACKRADETPLEYLCRLNVAGMRAKIHLKDGTVADRRKHVEHYIETVDDHNLAMQLTLLRLDDVDTRELTLHTYERMQKRKGNFTIISGKFRPRSASPYSLSPSKPARAVRAIHVGGERSSSESDTNSAESDEEQRRVYSATAADHMKDRGSVCPTKPITNDRERDHERAEGHKSCTHCGSKRHDDKGC